MFCRSKLQTAIVISTCKAEYSVLSVSMREVISLIQTLKKLSQSHNICGTPPAAAESKEPLSRTKHVAIKCHHFRNLEEKK